MSLVAELEINDQRVEFMADYVLKNMKLKPEKFSKCYNVDENKNMFIEFFEKHDRTQFVISATPAGVLSISFNWPTSLKAKSVYFVKRSKEAIQKDSNIRTALLYGDLSTLPMDQLSSFVDEVGSPLWSRGVRGCRFTVGHWQGVEHSSSRDTEVLLSSSNEWVIHTLFLWRGGGETNENCGTQEVPNFTEFKTQLLSGVLGRAPL